MLWAAWAALSLRAQEQTSLRGVLGAGPENKPVLRTPGGQSVFLSGDSPTEGVLRDRRLAGTEIEVVGRLEAADRLMVNPIHTRALFSWKNGKRQYITYWCEVCSIRTYTPGTCWCCQEETALDIRDNYS
jgi:hypothetical protein